MSGRVFRERVVLAVPIALALLTFYLTRDSMSAGSGHTSPGGFPRLVAGVLGVLALVRLFLPTTVEQSPNNTDVWHWGSVFKSMGAAALMGLYIVVFPTLPFLPITLVFLFTVFLMFDVRPVTRAALGAAGATLLLYVLFLYILGIAV